MAMHAKCGFVAPLAVRLAHTLQSWLYTASDGILRIQLHEVDGHWLFKQIPMPPPPINPLLEVLDPAVVQGQGHPQGATM